MFLVLTLLCSSAMSETSKELYEKAKSLFNDSSGKFTDPVKAIEYLNDAIKIQPDYADAYHARGNAYADIGKYKQAIKDFNEAIRLKPDNALHYDNRGGIYLGLGNYNLGCLDAQKACDLGVCRLLKIAKNNGACLFSVVRSGDGVKKRIEDVNILQKYFMDAMHWNPVITLDGKDKTTLILESVYITWMMVNAKFVEDEGMTQGLKDQGFKKVVFIQQRYNEKEINGWIWDIEKNTLE